MGRVRGAALGGAGACWDGCDVDAVAAQESGRKREYAAARGMGHVRGSADACGTDDGCAAGAHGKGRGRDGAAACGKGRAAGGGAALKWDAS